MDLGRCRSKVGMSACPCVARFRVPPRRARKEANSIDAWVRAGLNVVFLVKPWKGML